MRVRCWYTPLSECLCVGTCVCIVGHRDDVGGILICIVFSLAMLNKSQHCNSNLMRRYGWMPNVWGLLRDLGKTYWLACVAIPIAPLRSAHTHTAYYTAKVNVILLCKCSAHHYCSVEFIYTVFDVHYIDNCPTVIVRQSISDWVCVCVCKAVAAPHFVDYAPHRPTVFNDRVAVTHMHEHVFDQHFACNQSATRHKQVGKSHAPVVVVTWASEVWW